MAFEKGKPKPAGSGRKKGTPNKISFVTARAMMQAKNFDPFQELMKLSQNEAVDPEARIKALTFLARYHQAPPPELPPGLPPPENPPPSLDQVPTKQLLASVVDDPTKRNS